MSDKPKVILVVGGAGAIPGLSMRWLDAVRENAIVTEVHFDVESYHEGSIFTTEQMRAAERLLYGELGERGLAGLLPQTILVPAETNPPGRGCDHPSQVRHFKRKKGRS